MITANQIFLDVFKRADNMAAPTPAAPTPPAPAPVLPADQTQPAQQAPLDPIENLKQVLMALVGDEDDDDHKRHQLALQQSLKK